MEVDVKSKQAKRKQENRKQVKRKQKVKQIVKRKQVIFNSLNKLYMNPT